MAFPISPNDEPLERLAAPRRSAVSDGFDRLMLPTWARFSAAVTTRHGLANTIPPGTELSACRQRLITPPPSLSLAMIYEDYQSKALVKV